MGICKNFGCCYALHNGCAIKGWLGDPKKNIRCPIYGKVCDYAVCEMCIRYDHDGLGVSDMCIKPNGFDSNGNTITYGLT